MKIAERSAEVLRARVAATTVQTTPIDPARNIIGVKAGIHGWSVAKVVKGYKRFFFILIARFNLMESEPPQPLQEKSDQAVGCILLAEGCGGPHGSRTHPGG